MVRTWIVAVIKGIRVYDYRESISGVKSRGNLCPVQEGIRGKAKQNDNKGY